jgi:hypothetical protein
VAHRFPTNDPVGKRVEGDVRSSGLFRWAVQGDRLRRAQECLFCALCRNIKFRHKVYKGCASVVSMIRWALSGTEHPKVPIRSQKPEARSQKPEGAGRARHYRDDPAGTGLALWAASHHTLKAITPAASASPARPPPLLPPPDPAARHPAARHPGRPRPPASPAAATPPSRQTPETNPKTATTSRNSPWRQQPIPSHPTASRRRFRSMIMAADALDGAILAIRCPFPRGMSDELDSHRHKRITRTRTAHDHELTRRRNEAARRGEMAGGTRRHRAVPLCQLGPERTYSVSLRPTTPPC